jgi:hypothetical protein
MTTHEQNDNQHTPVDTPQSDAINTPNEPTEDNAPLDASPSSPLQQSSADQELSTRPKKAPLARKKPGLRPLWIVSLVTVIVFAGAALWFWFAPGFMPLAVALVSITVLVEYIALSRKKYRIALSSLLIAGLGIGGGYIWYNSPAALPLPALISPEAVETNIAVRVAEQDGEPVSRARVLLLYGGDIPIRQTTDSSGIATFTADSTFDEARLVTEANGYQVHEEVVRLSRSTDLTINLRSASEDIRSVIVRAVNDDNLQPISGAEVILIANGETFTDLTDANGLAKFEIEFVGEVLDADITVDPGDNNSINQNASLRPDQLQEIRLDTDDEQLNVAPVHAVDRADIRESIDQGLNVPVALENVTLYDEPVPTTEQEPNNEQVDAQDLETIGADHPVHAAIDSGGDRDYYAFDAIAGNTYVVELFNVNSNLGLTAAEYRCNGDHSTYTGLGLAVYDPGENTVASQCRENRGGNTFSGTSFVAEVNGRHVIEVYGHSDQNEGDYRLRVLANHDAAAATWQQTSFEPNNVAANAFPIIPGYQNALTSFIEEQESGYLAELADTDWYHFSASAGRTYVIELFHVDDLLSLGSSEYYCYGDYGTYSGMGLAIYQPNLDLVTSTCTPRGSGNVHTIATFTAEVNGIHYLRVFPHVGTVSGIYALRVLPKHDEPGAARDAATLEPNNRLPNAARLIPGEEVTSAIEERTPGYSTNASDMDWYHFQAEAGETYVVDILNVDDTLLLGSNEYYCYGDYGTYSGMGIAVFDAAPERVTVQCGPNSEGIIHTTVEFDALFNSDYYIHVFPHFDQAFGEYSIRVRTK